MPTTSKGRPYSSNILCGCFSEANEIFLQKKGCVDVLNVVWSVKFLFLATCISFEVHWTLSGNNAGV